MAEPAGSLARRREVAGVQGRARINVSYTTQDPYSAFTRFMRSDLHAPNGVNWGFYSDPEMDELLKNASAAKTDAERDEVARQGAHQGGRRGAVRVGRCTTWRRGP